MRKLLPIFVAAAILVALAGTTASPVAGRSSAPKRATGTRDTEYVVVYDTRAAPASARKAISAAGGTLVKENASLGTALVRAPADGFVVAVSQQASLDGAAANRPVGTAGRGMSRTKAARREVERLDAERLTAGRSKAPSAPGARKKPARGEPLADRQWDMDMIRTREAHRAEKGDRRVVVGIIDTGVDGSHPDIAPNFDAARSRNFTTDIPSIDGPCEEEPDMSCSDAADTDEDGHGTHVAGTIGSPINRLGIAGVAPNVTLVNIRAGQDSGYFFLAPSLDALTYAADIGVDVVNMSFYIDPWLYNCRANPADSIEDQYEQRSIIEATQRALSYATRRGVTLVSAAGNEDTDLGNPTFDDTSPDFPEGEAYERTVDNGCLSLPAEGNHVIGVTSVGPSGRKAYYSNYGLEQADVAAPGGDYRDFPGTPQNATPENLILAPYPTALAVANEQLNPDGTPNDPFVVRNCRGRTCAYYQYLQGTSMASPHAAGVAALIVSHDGRRDGRRGGLTLEPATVARTLKRTARDVPCPEPREFVYPELPETYTARCDGTTARNGFYGHGVIDAARAVGIDRR